MVDVPVVSDDLLDDRRPDFWLWSWRRRWGRRRGRRRGRRSALLFESDDDFVSNDFPVVLWWGLGARAADDKLLALPGNQLTTRAHGGWQAPLAAANRQRTSLSARVSAVTAKFPAVCTELKVAVVLLEADRASFSRDVAAVAAHFAAGSMEVDVAASAASKTHVIVIHLTRGRSADGSDRGPITTAEDDVIALGRTSRLLTAPDCDVVALHLSHRRGRRRAAAGGTHVIVKPATAAGCRAREDVVVTASHHQRAGGWAVVVLAKKVGHAAAGVRGGSAATAQLEVELLIVAVAAVTVAIEIALTLFIELCGGVAARHGAGSSRRAAARGEQIRRGEREGEVMVVKAAVVGLCGARSHQAEEEDG